MKYELKVEADTMDELLGLFNNLKDRPINELPKPHKVTLEVGDEATEEQPKKSEEVNEITEEPKAPIFTLADVQKKFKEKGAHGNKAHMREILQHYGAAKVSALKPEDYPAVMAELELVEA